MRGFLSAAFFALFASYASAECNNMCSGHGTCGANDMCTCYRNWRGNDCSERTCQYGRSFVETPQGDLDHDGQVDNPFRAANSQLTNNGALTTAGGTFFANNVQQLMIESGAAITVGGTNSYASTKSLTLTYTNSAGTALPATGSIEIPTIHDTIELARQRMALNIKTALDALTAAAAGTNQLTTTTDFTSVSVICSAGTISANDFACAITFNRNVRSAAYGGPFKILATTVTGAGATVTPTVVTNTLPATVITQWSPQGTFEGYGSYGGKITASTATGTASQSHAYMECSNKGLCDRASGECVCFDGYEGSACQRTVCPNSCSGNGICRNIVDMTNSLSTFTSRHTYNLWDGKSNRACVCDAGFFGPDCSSRYCPRNADPLVDNKVYEIQTITLTGKNDAGTNVAITVTPSFRLRYNDTYGESWITRRISPVAGAGIAASADIPTLATNIRTALLAIPNGVIQSAAVTCTADAAAPTEIHVCRVTFMASSSTANGGNAGDLTQLTEVLPKSAYWGTLKTTTNENIDVAFGTFVTATNFAEECSARGVCDHSTGLCKCFRGYRMDDCRLQHALAGAA